MLFSAAVSFSKFSVDAVWQSRAWFSLKLFIRTVRLMCSEFVNAWRANERSFSSHVMKVTPHSSSLVFVTLHMGVVTPRHSACCISTVSVQLPQLNRLLPARNWPNNRLSSSNWSGLQRTNGRLGAWVYWLVKYSDIYGTGSTSAGHVTVSLLCTYTLLAPDFIGRDFTARDRRSRSDCMANQMLKVSMQTCFGVWRRISGKFRHNFARRGCKIGIKSSIYPKNLVSWQDLSISSACEMAKNFASLAKYFFNFLERLEAELIFVICMMKNNWFFHDSAHWTELLKGFYNSYL